MSMQKINERRKELAHCPAVPRRSAGHLPGRPAPSGTRSAPPGLLVASWAAYLAWPAPGPRSAGLRALQRCRRSPAQPRLARAQPLAAPRLTLPCSARYCVKLSSHKRFLSRKSFCSPKNQRKKEEIKNSKLDRIDLPLHATEQDEI